MNCSIQYTNELGEVRTVFCRDSEVNFYLKKFKKLGLQEAHVFDPEGNGIGSLDKDGIHSFDHIVRN